MTNPSESEIMPTTILVDVQLQRTDAEERDASLQELRQLIETLEWKIAGTLTQKMTSLTAASGRTRSSQISRTSRARCRRQRATRRRASRQRRQRILSRTRASTSARS